LLDLIAGRLQAFFAASGGVLGQVRDGSVRALAVTAEARIPQLPEVPTMAEAGVPSDPAVAWIGMFGPANMPAERVARLAAEARVALQNPDQRIPLERAGFEPVGSSPAEFAALQRAEIARWGGLIRRLNIRPES
jgi:tripartite-type tricarboxylate transporter receptor subunit TctC